MSRRMTKGKLKVASGIFATNSPLGVGQIFQVRNYQCTVVEEVTQDQLEVELASSEKGREELARLRAGSRPEFPAQYYYRIVAMPPEVM
jgi:hypothetical protein